MPTGLRIPVGVDLSGGAAIETNSAAQNKKLLLLALSEGGDNNPFQNLGGFTELVFQIKEPSVRAKAEKRLRNIMLKFSDRMQLAQDSDIEFNMSESNQVTVSFSYVDLLTNTVEEFQNTFLR